MASLRFCKIYWRIENSERTKRTKTLIPFKSFKSANNKQRLETFLRFSQEQSLKKFLMYCEFQWKLWIVNCKFQSICCWKPLTWMIRVLGILVLRFDCISYWILYFELFSTFRFSFSFYLSSQSARRFQNYHRARADSINFRFFTFPATITCFSYKKKSISRHFYFFHMIWIMLRRYWMIISQHIQYRSCRRQLQPTSSAKETF